MLGESSMRTEADILVERTPIKLIASDGMRLSGYLSLPKLKSAINLPTVVGMTMTPGKFACGVDNVGVSDLATLLEDFPPYWKPSMHLWHRYVGGSFNP